MKVLVVGGGGREHALAWKVAQSRRVDAVFVAPGNAGTARERKCENVAIVAEDIEGLQRFASERQIELTIVGPEAPLVAGIIDRFQDTGLPCFGPTKAAAQLEGSKAFTKAFLDRHHIPTAASATFTDTEAATTYIKKVGAPIVVKADGLAAGKGVILAQTEAGAAATVQDMLVDNVFGEAGHRVVIEEFLWGEEASFIVMADGEHILPLATAQDHKARNNGDTGPNTGGMGAYSPAPVITSEIHQRIMTTVIEPTVRGMAAEGYPYTGFLYAGLMIEPDGTPKVLEFNCRFGDPEAQPILLRLKSDLAQLCEAALARRLNRMHAEWDERAALGVVLAAGGYPGKYAKGEIITGLHDGGTADAKVFHAGTAEREGKIVTNGGRVLCVTALGDTVSEAQQRAYELTKQVNWRNVYYRSDIGHRAVAREAAR